MKILVVASTMVHINNFHKEYIEALKEEGNQVYVMAKGEGADFNIPFEKKALSLKNLSLVKEIKKILKEEDFDVAYLHTTLAAFYVRLAMKGLKKRPFTVNTVHGYLFNKQKRGLKGNVYLACEKYVKGQTDVVITMNNEDYEIATENKLSMGNIYKIAGMGIALPEIKPERVPSKDGKIRLTFIGELSKRKNQEFLIRAIKDLSQYSLTLVGNGDMMEKLKALVKKLGMEERVVFAGHSKDVYSHLASTDIYVSASKIEGLPFNILEAMHMDLPILASNVKGHLDLLPEDQLFEPDSYDDFKNKLLALSYGCNYSYDISRYKKENVFLQNLKIYKELK